MGQAFPGFSQPDPLRENREAVRRRRVVSNVSRTQLAKIALLLIKPSNEPDGQDLKSRMPPLLIGPNISIISIVRTIQWEVEL